MHIDYDGTILVSMLLSAGGGCFACPKSTDAGMLLALRTCYCACATFADVHKQRTNCASSSAADQATALMLLLLRPRAFILAIWVSMLIDCLWQTGLACGRASLRIIAMC